MFEDMKRTRIEAARLQQAASEARIVGRALRDLMNSRFDMAYHQLDRAMRTLRESRRLTRPSDSGDGV